jgi:macrolide transport system ATP-binding/permease protein
VNRTSNSRPGVVEARNLTKSFRQGTERIPVLADVNLRLEAGSMTAVLGPSGSGKSTLLNILGLLVEPDEGELIIGGENAAHLATAGQARLRLERVAFVFQSFHLIEHKTVAENIELPLILQGKSRQIRRGAVEEVLRRLGMEHRRDSFPSTLSGGEKQRVAIARAVVTKPTLLLCDEPTGSLDSARSADVIELLRSITGPDQATVIVTHDAGVAEQCDTAIHIRDGRIVEQTAGGSSSIVSPQPRGRGRTSGAEHHRWRWTGLGIRQALHASRRRMKRNTFTMIGAAIGVASLVLTVGLSATISAQLSDKFNLYLAQRVTLAAPQGADAISAQQARQWQSSAGMQRLADLHGVQAAGVIQDVSGGAATISLTPEYRGSFDGRIQAPVLAVTPAGLDAEGVRLTAGRLFDDGHVSRSDDVAVIGRSLLQSLGRNWQPGMTVYAANTPFQIVGVVQEDLSSTDNAGALYVPLGNRLSDSAVEGPTKILLKTASGAASQVAGEATAAWDPTSQSQLTASAPPEPTTLRQAVDDQQRNLMIAMAGVTLLIGGVGIMNTFLVSVMERRREIGLRMALGSTPGAIRTQFAAEAVIAAAGGAVLGVIAAVNALAVISLLNHWIPVIEPASIGIGIGAGLLIGLIAGLYPAHKASQIDPVETLSQG